ncbi:hypothetical protein SAY86_023093 [Trapa natans]|uniref:BZIP domain-containing protein n=1 Tax=Trapa natans TaxID=22666 RepID=A0AAN7LPF9_TRANT|nr:hypothetical protein SAY86_023093 [Trapa natans]
MGGSEADKLGKEKETKKAAPTTTEPPATTSTAPVNPEWPGFQAYPHIPPHGFLASSPQAPPYMWGVQHIMPPYGTPPHPYVAMYPHGGIYAHPSMPPGSYPFSPFSMPSPNGIMEVSTPGTAEGDGKPSNVKEKLPIKRSKGCLGSLSMITGKTNDDGKTSGNSANGSYSKSAESDSDGTSEGCDENSHNESRLKLTEVSQNGNSVHGPQNGGPYAPHVVSPSMSLVPITAASPLGSVPGPATNLNIGMDYWNTPASSHIPALQGKATSTPVTGATVPAGSRDNQSQMWLQDERELKRQKRKQSNRESARRSRLRKQAECDDLARRADILKEENTTLRAEVSRVRSEYEKLLEENTSLKERSGTKNQQLICTTQQTAS